MVKFWSDLLFGLAFGIGFALAWAVIQFVIFLLSHAQMPGPMVVKDR
jgi:hypothetical protein